MVEFTTMKELPDQVFCLWDGQSHPVWFALVDGKVVKATWLSKGAAQAGMLTEQRRLKKKETEHVRQTESLRDKLTQPPPMEALSEPKLSKPRRTQSKFVAGRGELKSS